MSMIEVLIECISTATYLNNGSGLVDNVMVVSFCQKELMTQYALLGSVRLFGSFFVERPLKTTEIGQ